MANALQNLMYIILARSLKQVLRPFTVMPQLVNQDLSTDAKSFGDTVDIIIPGSQNVVDIVPSANNPSPVDSTPLKRPLALDKWKGNEPFHLTDKEMIEINTRRDYLPTKVEEAVKAITSYINTSIMEQYKGVTHGVYGFIGTPGTTPFADTATPTDARKLLNKQLAPKSGRSMVLDVDAGAKALRLSEIADAEKTGENMTKIEGEIGRKYGFNFFEDQDVLTHTAGTITDASAGRTCAVDNGAGYAIGDDTIDVDNGAEATVVGTMTRGDIFTFGGHDQTYCVVDNASSAQFVAPNYTFATNAIAGLKFYPPLVAAVADDEVITVKDDHVVNLAFHRDAFAYAQRLTASDSKIIDDGKRNVVFMQDDLTGLILRLELLQGHKMTLWEFDVLFGTILARPELAIRIAG